MENTPMDWINKKTAVIAVLLLSGIISFWMLRFQSLDSHECFVSVTAREMLTKHEYAWPTLNNLPRLQKTPLNYWLVAGIGTLTGSIDEVSARLPSAVAAVGSTLLLLYYLRRWFSPRTAAISAAVWATSLACFRCAHSARPDMVMSFFTILCTLSFYAIATSENPKDRKIQQWFFWIGFALANLAKGPAPVAYVAVPILGYIILTRDWRVVGKLFSITGILLFLAILLPWPLFIAHKLNWNLILWKQEFIDRFFGDYAPANYPIYYYFGVMFKYSAPWVVFLPIALMAPINKFWDTKRPAMMFFWVWFVAGLIFLTIDGGKRQHYILPFMPAMAILIGLLLDDMIFARRVCTLKFATGVLWAHIVTFIVIAIAGPIVITFKARPFLMPVLFLSAVMLIATILTTLFLQRNVLRGAVITIFMGILIYVMTCFYAFSEALDKDSHSRDFAKTVSRMVPPSDTLVSYHLTSSRFIQYYGKSVPFMDDLSKLQACYDKGDWIVCLSDQASKLKEMSFQVVYSGESVEPTDGKHKSDADGMLFHK
jgi:4-amino-4-deoxy-L-arabinose transferase-like glycosyltransferase